MVIVERYKACLALWIVLCSVVMFSGNIFADRTVAVNTTTSWGTWEGWGCSLCWWAAEFGDRDDLADILFTTNYTMLNNDNLPGLGMTIARYNAGACSWNPVEGEIMQESKNIYETRQMEGFWVDWYSGDPNSGDWDWYNEDPNSDNWDWTVDSKQRQMLIKAKDRGATHFELFSNSPMWWMCYNNNPSGADYGFDDNLEPEHYDEHAVYLATVAKRFKDYLGVTFTTVDPFNEPMGYWASTGTQEGCHFDWSTQATVLAHLRTELDSRGLDSTAIAASDESGYSAALYTWKSFDPNTKSLIDQVNVHGYQYLSGPRSELYYLLSGRKLWNTEFGGGDSSGLELAQNLSRDMRQLHPTAWCYWQPFDWMDWGLIDANLETHRVGRPEQKYYVLAQYTRHIRPGFTIIDSGEEKTVAAYNRQTRQLVLVTLNDEASQSLTYDLSGFASAAGPVQHWRTHLESGDKYSQQSQITLSGSGFTAWLDENCVQTFVVENVDQPGELIGVTPRPGYWYKIIARHSGKCLEVQGDETSTGDGVNVQQWDFLDEQNQQWKLEDAGSGYYRLTPRHAQDKCLNVKGGSDSDGANIEQSTYNESLFQKWKPIPAEDGYFAIMSQGSEKSVEVSYASTENGANVLQWACANNDNQLWQFVELEPACLINVADGDLDGDCHVSLNDISILAEYWQGPCTGSPLEGMFGGGCTVDLDHLIELAENWTECGWLETELCGIQ